MQVKTETGRIKDVGILEVTPENFICPANERSMYHCRIEIKKFNPETGERLSKPRIQVFGKKFFETFGLHNLRKQGYTVDILHDPNQFVKANRERIAAEERAKAKAEKEAERQAIRAQILEELKAEGKLKEPEEEPEKEPEKVLTEEEKDNNMAKTENARRVGRPKNSEKTEV